jgi:adenylate kinase family enzyme/YHS domain-containing protein
MAANYTFKSVSQVGKSFHEFSFERKQGNVPYHLQADPALDTPQLLAERSRIKHDPQFMEAVGKFWKLLQKNAAGRIEKSNYIQLCLRLAKLVLPDFSIEKTQEVIELDWDSDSGGAPALDYGHFYEAMFQFADLWTSEIDAKEYSSFLHKVFRRVTVQHVFKPNGTFETHLPEIKLVFPQDVSNPEDLWEEVDSDESLDSEFEYDIRPNDKGERSRYRRQKDWVSEHEVKDKATVMYDEVVDSDWEEGDALVSLTLAEVNEIIPLGKVAENYLAGLKHAESAPQEPQSEEVSESIHESSFEERKLDRVSNRMSTIRVEIDPETQKKLQGLVDDSSDLSLIKVTSIRSETSYSTTSNVPRASSTASKRISFLKNVVRAGMLLRRKQTDRDDEPSDVIDLSKQVLDKWTPHIRKTMKEKARSESKAKKKGIPMPIEEPKEEQIFSEDASPAKFLRGFSRILKEDPITPEKDIMSLAAGLPDKIFVLGPPRSGRSIIAKIVADKFQMVLLEPHTLIQEVLDKEAKEIAQREEDEGSDEPRPDILSAFERKLVEDLRSGLCLSDDQIKQLVMLKLESGRAQSRGIVVDFPMKIDPAKFAAELPFSQVIEIEEDLKDVLSRVTKLRVDSATDVVYTQKQIYDILHPKKLSEEDEEEDPDEDSGPRLRKDFLLNRPEDESLTVQQDFEDYCTTIRPLFDGLIESLAVTHKIKLKTQGRSAEQLAELAIAKFENIIDLKPPPVRLDPENDFKALLTQNLEEGQEPRKWSLWKQTDPVALVEGRLEEGSPENSCEYAGNVFVFKTESNADQFSINPQKFLKSEPRMPTQYRVAIIGAAKTGKRTQAEYLAAKYSWKLVETTSILHQTLFAQKRAKPTPSHPDAGVVQASLPELQKLLTGGALPSNELIPIILHKQGVPLMKRPPPPPEPKSDDENAEEVNQQEEKASESEESEDEQVNSKEVEEPGEGEEPEEPEPIVYDDLPLNEIVVKVGPDGKPATLDGFLMLGYPVTVEDAQTLKDLSVEFDKVIYLVDETEGEELIKRGILEEHVLENQTELATQAINAVKEVFGEELVVEISTSGSAEDIHAKICTAIDPFYYRLDDDAVVLGKDELPEEGVPVIRGEYGHYDPVLIARENWLFPGSEEFEAKVSDLLYSFAGESELEAFKARTDNFIPKGILALPPPHIMVTGPRGSGTTALIGMLEERLKVPGLRLKDIYLATVAEETRQRRMDRLLKRGFVPRDTENDDPEQPFDPLEHDPEIVEEADDFDLEQHERNLMRRILPGSSAALLNGNWYEVDDKVSQGFIDLLHSSRRLPEVVLMLRKTDEQLVKDCLDFNGIRLEYERLYEARRAEKAAAREVERKQRIKDGEDPEEIDREYAEQEEEEDLEAPNLETMLTEAKEKLQQRKEADDAQLEDIKASLEEKGIPVVVFDGEMPKHKLLKAAMHELEIYTTNREQLIERELVVPLKRQKAEELIGKSLAQLSVFRRLSAISPHSLPTVLDFPMLYRGRVYYLKSEAERTEFKRRPLLYTRKVSAAPREFNTMPVVSVLGQTNAGKTELATVLTNRFGLVRITVKSALESLLSRECELQEQVLAELQAGRMIDDRLQALVVLDRMQQPDVVRSGCVLDNFPQTIPSALFLAQHGVIPNPVLYLSIDLADVKARLKDKFAHIYQVMQTRDRVAERRLNDLSIWFQSTYDNIRYIDSTKSKWHVRDAASDFMNAAFKAQRIYSIAAIQNTPVPVAGLTFARTELNSRLSKFKKYCPVEWRFRGKLVEITHYEWVLEYNNEFYYFASHPNLQAFVANPNNFLRGNVPTPEDLAAKIPKPKPKIAVPEAKSVPLNMLAEFENSVAYLEQALAQIVTKALLEVGNARLRHPELSLRGTALRHFSLYLKANNPKYSGVIRQKYAKLLTAFKNECVPDLRSLPIDLKPRD